MYNLNVKKRFEQFTFSLKTELNDEEKTNDSNPTGILYFLQYLLLQVVVELHTVRFAFVAGVIVGNSCASVDNVMSVRYSRSLTGAFNALPIITSTWHFSIHSKLKVIKYQKLTPSNAGNEFMSHLSFL